jgi:hypothetical protein
MRSMNVAHAVVLGIDMAIPNRHPTDTLRAVAARAEATGYGSVHPRSPLAKVRLEEQLHLGARGLKLHPPNQLFRPDAWYAMRIYRWCGAANIPVFFHAGPAGIEPKAGQYCAQMRFYERPLRELPGTTFVLGHAGSLQHREGDRAAAPVRQRVARDLRPVAGAAPRGRHRGRHVARGVRLRLALLPPGVAAREAADRDRPQDPPRQRRAAPERASGAAVGGAGWRVAGPAVAGAGAARVACPPPTTDNAARTPGPARGRGRGLGVAGAGPARVRGRTGAAVRWPAGIRTKRPRSGRRVRDPDTPREASRGCGWRAACSGAAV